MAKTIKMSLDSDSIDKAVKQIEEVRKDLITKCKAVTERLAEIGYDTVYSVLDNHVFSGKTLSNLKVEYSGIGEKGNQYTVSTESEAILILEFGSGVKHSGTVNPKSAEFGMGAGTYPGAGHWDDPDGWWFPTDEPSLIRRYDENGQGWGHSFGMEAKMPFYKAAREIEAQVNSVVKEVFG